MNQFQLAMTKAISWKERDYSWCVVFGNGKTTDSLFREFKQLTEAIAFSHYCRGLKLKTKLFKQGIAERTKPKC